MSRKFLITIILILFLLPFVSWYYLQSGLNWRKQAQAVMNGTTPFPSISCLTNTRSLFSQDSLEGRVTLITYLPCASAGTEQASVLKAVFDQFKDTHKASYILLDTCDGAAAPDLPGGKYGWFVFQSPDSCGLSSALQQGWPADHAYALVDRKGIIRAYYKAETPEEKKTLVEHMALLLPRERQEEVELKRGEKK